MGVSMELGHSDDPYLPFLSPRIAGSLVLDYVEKTEDVLQVEEAAFYEGGDHEQRADRGIEWMTKALGFASYCESRGWGDAVDCRDTIIAIEEVIALIEASRAVSDRLKMWRDYKA